MITEEEIRFLLQMETSNIDIKAYIKQAKHDVIDYCNNHFVNPNVRFNGYVDINNNNITSEDEFTDFIAGDYYLHGSKYNDGIITISDVATGEISSSDDLINESDSLVSITLIQYPKGIKTPLSEYIKYLIETKGKLVTSESVSGYNATFKSRADIMKPFNRWRRI